MRKPEVAAADALQCPVYKYAWQTMDNAWHVEYLLDPFSAAVATGASRLRCIAEWSAARMLRRYVKRVEAAK